MTTYKVTAVTWNGYTQGEEITDPTVSPADLDVLVKIGVLALVSADSIVEVPAEVTPEVPAETPPQPETGDTPNGDLSQ